MHVHLPKPLDGWRAFVGEVGIIVIDVSIALSAEQLVEALHWRNEVASSDIRSQSTMTETSAFHPLRTFARGPFRDPVYGS